MTYHPRRIPLMASKKPMNYDRLNFRQSFQNSQNESVHTKNSLWKSLLMVISVLAVIFSVTDSIATEGPISCDALMGPPKPENLAEKEKKAPKKEREEKTSVAKSEPRRKATLAQYKLEDFFQDDPEKNLAYIHPSTVMKAEQKFYRLLNLVPPREILDPEYRVKKMKMYPVLYGEHPATSDIMMASKYSEVATIVNSIAANAMGARDGKSVLLLGPAGTGKTEIFKILNRILDYQLKKDPEFYEYSFEWIGLDQIPGTKPLLPKMAGEYIDDIYKDQLSDSPFVLLREDMQEEVLRKMENAISQKIRFPLIAWKKPSYQAAAIMDAVFKFYFPEIKNREIEISDLTKEEYLSTLAKHIRIYRRNTSGGLESPPPDVLPALPNNPNYSKLFVSEDIRKQMVYQANNPLAYNFVGEILLSHGRALIADEVFRNPEDFLNLLLELIQNKIAKTDTGPAVNMNVLLAFAANDESLEHAASLGPTQALLSRMIKIPFRWDLHPYDIAKTAIIGVGTHLFQMRSLETANDESGHIHESPIVPLKINEVIPLPRGVNNPIQLGPHNRYALYVKHMNDQILISPQALEFIGLVASASRIEIRDDKFAKFTGELQDMSANRAFYTSIKSRLDVFLGRNPGDAVRADLSKVKDLLDEGSAGLGSRETIEWLNKAIALAHEKGESTLTPAIVDEAFMEKMRVKSFITPGMSRTELLNRYQIVKDAFIMPELYKDIRNIVSGDGERADRLYDTIENEIIARTENEDATVWIADGGIQHPIQFERWEKIKSKYQELYHREFKDSFLLKHAKNARGGVSRDPQLLEAVRAFLIDTEQDLTDSLSRFRTYYEGRNNDPSLVREVNEAEARLSRYGYNRASFRDAVVFFGRLQMEKKQHQK